MDRETQRTLKRFLLETDGGAPLGASNDSRGKSKSEREADALAKLFRQREALIRADKWRTTLPTVAVVVFAVAAIVVGALTKDATATASAIAGAIASMFRLLQVNQQQKTREMVFALIELGTRDGRYPPAELVELILKASNSGTSPSPLRQPQAEA
jgi:hypothetical protein